MNIPSSGSFPPPIPLASTLPALGRDPKELKNPLPPPPARNLSSLPPFVQQTSSSKETIVFPAITRPSLLATSSNASSSNRLADKAIKLAARRSLTEQPGTSLKTPRNTDEVIRDFDLNNMTFSPLQGKLAPLSDKESSLANPGKIRARRSREQNIDASSLNRLSPTSSFSTTSTRSTTPLPPLGSQPS